MDRYPKIIKSSKGVAYTTSEQAYNDYWKLSEHISNMNVFDSKLEQEKQYSNELYDIACKLEFNGQ